MGRAINPGHGAPTMPVCGMHLAQGRSNDLDLRMLLAHLIYHAEKSAWVQLGFRGNLRAGDANTLLEVLLIAHQHIDMLDYAIDDFESLFMAADGVPKLFAVVQVVRDHRAGGFGGLHGLNGDLRSAIGERGENSSTVEPADTAGKDRFPIEIAGLKPGRRFIRPVIEDNRRAHT